MKRTQVYLTEEERKALKRIADQRGTSKSALIREAVDRLIEEERRDSWKDALRRARGMWADRDDLPDFEALRREWDRFPEWTNRESSDE